MKALKLINLYIIHSYKNFAVFLKEYFKTINSYLSGFKKKKKK